MKPTKEQAKLSRANYEAYNRFQADPTDANYHAWQQAEKAWKREARRRQERELLDGE